MDGAQGDEMGCPLFKSKYQWCSPENLSPLPDVHSPIAVGGTYLWSLILPWHTGHRDTMSAFMSTALIKATRENSPSGSNQLQSIPRGAPTYRVPVAGPVLKVPEISADVWRRVWEPSLVPHALEQMTLTLESTAGAVSVLSSCWMEKSRMCCSFSSWAF